ncbi:MAG: Lrp/AsnC family transcriptional regulator [Betaproteobacteria bacterium]|nr:Lrp/AsnC family transcriptional regulator [Betaproteobacteria bacterium]
MDKIDRIILGVLARDGRISFRDLGDKVHLSPNATAERVRKLQQSGAIRAIRAEINPAALGQPLEVQIDVKLESGTAASTFERVLAGMPQVKSATLMTGSFDYAVRVNCADRDELVRVTEALRAKGGVRETYSRMILREVGLG